MKLIYYEKEIIWRGYILRCRGVQPYEEVVDFLVCESIDVPNTQSYFLMVSSGYKAGLRHCQFPKESIPDGHIMGLKTKWLIENWSKWGYINCKIEDVYILENSVPIYPPIANS